jgi:hypothetical protein
MQGVTSQKILLFSGCSTGIEIYGDTNKPNRLMLENETVAVYCENYTESTDTVCTSQETNYVSATGTNRLMLFWETVAVYCERKHVEHISFNSKADGMSGLRAWN